MSSNPLFKATSCQIDGETKTGTVLAISYKAGECRVCFQVKGDRLGTWVPESGIRSGQVEPQLTAPETVRQEADLEIQSLQASISDLIQAIRSKAERDIETVKNLLQWAKQSTQTAIQLASEIDPDTVNVQPIFAQFSKSVSVGAIATTLDIYSPSWLQFFFNLFEGIDKQKARQEVLALQAQYPNDSPKQIVDRLIQRKVLSLIAYEIVELITEETLKKILETQDITVDFNSATYALEELIYQIGVCYGFDDLNFYESLAVFATVFTTDRVKQLGVDFISTFVPGTKRLVNASLNVISFYAIGYAARRYFQWKSSTTNLLNSDKTYQQVTGEVQVLVDEQIQKESQIDEAVRETVILTEEFVESDREPTAKVKPPIRKPDQTDQFRATGVLIAAWQPDPNNSRSGVFTTPDSYEFPGLIIPKNWSPASKNCNKLAAWNVWVDTPSESGLWFGLKGFLRYPQGDLTSPDNLMDRFSIRGHIKSWNLENNQVEVTVALNQNYPHKYKSSTENFQPLHLVLYGRLPNLEPGAFWDIEATRDGDKLTIVKGKEVFAADSPDNPKVD